MSIWLKLNISIIQIFYSFTAFCIAVIQIIKKEEVLKSTTLMADFYTYPINSVSVSFTSCMPRFINRPYMFRILMYF